MNTDLDFNQPINVTPMSATEARECIDAIKGNLESLRLMLLELHRRRGWEVLGYASWEDCAIAEFGKSRSYVFKLLSAAQVQENLASTVESPIGDLQDIPASQLTQLAKLPLEQQTLGLLKAEEIAQAQGKKRNATHIAQAVKELKSVAAETAALGKSLGLPTRGNSTLPDSDRIDDLTHTSLADVDDRPFAGIISQHELTPNPVEVEDVNDAIANSVEPMEYEPDYEKSAPTDLSEVSSASDIDALIDFHGSTVVARMYVAASPELQRIIKNYYPGIGALVTSELGGSEFNKIANQAGFLPNQEPDAVRVEMLLQENARLDETLRLSEERAQRLERENSELHRKLESQQTELLEAQAEIERLSGENRKQKKHLN